MSETELLKVLDAVGGSWRYREWIFQKIEDDLGDIVLDTGSGLGDFSGLFLRNAKRTVILSDASETMTKKIRESYRHIPNVKVLEWDISKRASLEGHAVPDTVTCLNVLEHVTDDVQALGNIHHLVKPGGKIILFVPALSGLYGSLDRVVGHHRRYTKRSLTRGLEGTGWKILRMEYFNFFGMATWFLSGKILRQKHLNAGTCGLLDRVVPWLSFIERHIQPPIGQSLIAVAQKAF